MILQKKLKELYAYRWGIETSFRDLKYSIGLTHFHAKKKEGILQEKSTLALSILMFVNG
ncbi:transposase [Streptococcus suis]